MAHSKPSNHLTVLIYFYPFGGSNKLILAVSPDTICGSIFSLISCKSRAISLYCLRIMRAISRGIAVLYYTLLVTWVNEQGFPEEWGKPG